jgi:hypothetical protein
MLGKALEMGVCFHRGPAFGEHGGTLFSRAFERKGNFSLFRENFYEEFERDIY